MHLRDRLYAFLRADELAHNAHNARRDKMASSTSPLPIIDKIGNAHTHTHVCVYTRPVHKNIFLEFPKMKGSFVLHFDR